MHKHRSANDSNAVKPKLNVAKALLLRAIVDIDEAINEQINAILHHERFQQIEASWRGLRYLCGQAGTQDNYSTCKVKLLNVSWRELCRDSARAIDFDQSDLFRHLYTAEFSTPGGEPFGLVIGDYQITHRPRKGYPAGDLQVLRTVSHVCAAAFSPFITSAQASLFGVNHFSELASVQDIGAQFSQPEYGQWQALRAMEDSRFLAIAAPNILMREPHKQSGSGLTAFQFQETIGCSERDYLWGNAAYGVAAVAVRAFRESGWFSQIRGMQPSKLKHGLMVEIPSSGFEHSRSSRSARPSVDLQIGDRLEAELSDNGFIAISTLPHTPHLVLYSNTTVNLPVSFDNQSASVNARLSSMLQYMLCVARFAHYLKVMGRDKVGGYNTAQHIENEMQRWLHQYTAASDEASDEIRAKYPLNEAKIQVKEQQAKPGHYYSVIHLRPHFQLEHMVSNIRLITELSPIFTQVG
jgi:type VI secretion system protein ImpD